MKNPDDIDITSAKDFRIAELEAEVERLKKLQPNLLFGKLTDAKIRKLNRRGRHNDSPNLYIQVPNVDSDERSWLFGWVDPATGKFTQKGLGSYPLVSIDQARTIAQRYRLLLLAKKDLKKETIREDTAIQLASGLIRTVKQVALEWFNTKIKSKSPGYARKIENQLEKYVYNTIGNLLVEQVDQKTITDDAEPNIPRVGLKRLMSEMWPTGHDIQTHLERIFDYAIYKGYSTKANPAAWATLQYLMPDRDDVYEREHRDSLPIDKVYDFLQKLDAIEDRSVRKTGHPMLALLIKAAALTGVRIGELIKARQSEFDGDTYNVPWQHRKHGKRKKKTRPIRPIPITPSFRRVLDQAGARRKQIRLADDPNALVFPSDKQGHIGKMIKTSSPSTFIRRNFPGLKLHPHGFRSTLRDWRRKRTTFFDELWKLQVDHNLGDATDESYGPDLLLEDRREMMDCYDAFCSMPFTPQPKQKVGPRKSAEITYLNRRRTA